MDLLLQTLGSGEGPDNADNDGDMVKELFAKFNNPTAGREEELAPQSKSEPSVMVEIPATSTSDLSQYDFLPGHFDVRYVISEISEVDAGLSYQVKLQSGETETMSFAQLQSLQNGPESLSNFLNYGPDHYISSRSASAIPSEEQSSSSDSDIPDMRRSRRATRGQRSGFTAFFEAISSDEGTRRTRRKRSPSSEDIIASSGATSKKRRVLRRRDKNTRSVVSLSDESDYSAPKGTRHSTRTRKSKKKSLRERNEDDISDAEDAPRMQKFFGAKEFFRKVPEHDAFRQRHRNVYKSLEPCMTAEEAIPEDFLLVDIVFDVRYSSASPDTGRKHTFEEDVARVDDVVEMYVKFKGLPYEEATWDTPPERSSNPERWESFRAAYEDWVKREYTHIPNQDNLRRRIAHVRKQNFSSNVVKSGQPETMTGGQIMDYQKDGLDWLYYMWYKQQNAILADEMGLGKTIQVIGLIATLVQYHKCWPFLIVVPNSTCPNWRKEIKTWVPSLRVVTYYGSAFSRKLAQDYEMFADDDTSLRCHVVVASYETLVDDASRRLLSKVPWAGLIVDEGQRLKNDKSQLYDALSRIRFPFKILLTGTPLQNNIRELFNLLQFCDPSKRADDLENEYGDLSTENILELHNMIRPFFLRRTKAQVLSFLPPVAQIIVPVSMTTVQKKLYKFILAKNPQLIKAIFQRKEGTRALKQTEKHNLNNILMQLRKCLCHPFVYSRAIEEKTSNAAVSHRHLVDAAAKFQLLELMLPKLKNRGHRVLIFSQFLENLDIIEDFLEGVGLTYLRLDGRMSSLEKQKTIDAYNAEESPYFAFLLSTRSGGVGINLATADTVIIMDPDFNPHQDMQALSRAHRIGQKNKVLVFQLMTRASAEEKIMQIGKKKMVLDHVLIDRMVSEEDDGRDLETILRHGAQALFDDDDSGDVRYDSESVDKLLDRSQAEQASTPDDSNQGNQFSFARVWANDNQNLEDQLQNVEEEPAPSADVWEKILREREQAAAEEARRKAETLGRGKRKRTAVDYANDALMELSPNKDRPAREQAESDREFRADDAMESESDFAPDLDSDDMGQVAKTSKVHAFQRVPQQDLPPPLDGNVEPVPHQGPPCIACNRVHVVGHCRLKMAGVEHCPLCGLAHYGYSRTCPHLRSDTQVSRMLAALKESTEDRELVQLAKKYLNGIRGDLAQRKRKQASKAASSLTNHGIPTTNSNANPVVATNSPMIDLTGQHNTQTTHEVPSAVGATNSSTIDLTTNDGTRQSTYQQPPWGASQPFPNHYGYSGHGV
nr:chromatin remodeling complex subunit (Chd3) [Aspergillus niger CBS 513.88]|eukprot:XP_001389337.2 chromatin remodeling complex subunit (Chd3) [Aspergillus niger CBS 513.88]